MDTLTSRLLCSTNFWSMWKMVRAASMWSEMSHKSCFISSRSLAEKDELLFSPPSHSHVYLSVICALEQRLLMPCLWYMTHQTEQLFILWINPERRGEKCKPDCHQPGALSLFLCAPLHPPTPPTSSSPPLFLVNLLVPSSFLRLERAWEHHGQPSLVANCLSDLCLSLLFIISSMSPLSHPHNK